METRFLISALSAGRTATAVRLGTILTLGRFWVRTSRCYTVYRGQDGVMDYDKVQAVMDVDDSQVSIPAQALPAGTIWHFVRRQVSDCGLESADSDAAVVVIDSACDMIGRMPNAPQSLEAEQVAGGKIKVRWRYSRLNQEIMPTGFKVYIDSGGGFDFDTADAIIAYDLGGNGEFEWQSDTLSNGQSYKFCVRASWEVI